MKEVTIQELKRRLSAFIRRAAAGERIVITRHNRPVASLGGPAARQVRRGKRFGKAELRGLFRNATRGRGLASLREDRGIGKGAR